MGFRSTLISQHIGGDLPQWFKDKYTPRLIFPNGSMIASAGEFKIYSNELFEDYKKALLEGGFFDKHYDPEITISVLAEDGVVSKVVITKGDIEYYQEDEWVESEKVWLQGY
jgi:hypothetical protein